MKNKIINVKLKEKDIDDLMLILTDKIICLQDKIKNKKEIDGINFKINMYKQLITKLEVAKWYSEEI